MEWDDAEDGAEKLPNKSEFVGGFALNREVLWQIYEHTMKNVLGDEQAHPYSVALLQAVAMVTACRQLTRNHGQVQEMSLELTKQALEILQQIEVHCEKEHTSPDGTKHFCLEFVDSVPESIGNAKGTVIRGQVRTTTQVRREVGISENDFFPEEEEDNNEKEH